MNNNRDVIRVRDRIRNKVRQKNPTYRAKRNAYRNVWRKTTEKGRAECRNRDLKRAANPIHRFKSYISHGLRTSFLDINSKKFGRRTEELLGYSKYDLYEYLIAFLERPCEWCQKPFLPTDRVDIDHIIPTHTARTEEDIIRLNQLSNLRLLHAFCNGSKSGKLPSQPPK